MKKSLIRNLINTCCVFFIISTIILLSVANLNIFWTYGLLFAAPFAFLIIYTFIYIRGRIIKPVQSLIKETEIISAGDLSHQITPKTNDELGNLILAFDEMRSKLFEQQQKQLLFEVERKNFIDSISHDLKTPLASISAYVEALQDGIVTTPAEQQQYLKVIEKKVSLMTEISNQLSLSYESPESLFLTYQEVNCYDWVIRFFQDIQAEGNLKQTVPQLENKIEPQNKATMMIDIHQFERAIQNMVTNAFRYAQNELVICCEIRQGKFYLEITNDGVDLTDEQFAQIFERFFTQETVKEKGHLGLGLSISKTIIESLGGITKASKVGEKIIFEVILPLI